MTGASEAGETRPQAEHRSAWIEERPPSLHDYLAVFHRRWRIVAGALLATLSVAVAVSLTTRPVYRASTTVTTDKTPQMVLLDKRDASGLAADQAASQAPDVATLVELVKSDAVREGAMFRLAATMTGDIAAAALDNLNVQQVRQTELVRISIEYTDPSIAAEVANAMAASLVDANLKARRHRASETRTFIGGELQAASQHLGYAEDVLKAFRESHGDVSLSQETIVAIQKLADLKVQLLDVGLQRDAARSRLAEIRARFADAGGTPTQPSPLVASLQDQLAKLEIELSGMRLEFTPKHPAILDTDAKIVETRQRLTAELAKGRRAELDQANLALTALNDRQRAMQNAVADYELRARSVPLRELDLARLTRAVKESEDIYRVLSTQYQEARIAENSIGSVIRVVDAARAPHAPVRPRRQMNVLFGGLLGLMVGVGGAFVAELLDDTVKSAEEIERALGVPVLGGIPVTTGARGVDKHDAPNEQTPAVPPLAVRDRYSPAAEAYRALRTHVLFSMPDVERKRLLITSALPREGKTTIAANLAVAIAQTDRRVWLIDGDMRRPELSRWFGGGDTRGLAGLLAGQAEVDSVVRPSVEPDMWFVESGPTVPNPAELLGSQRMIRLMERARAEAEVVLVDSPPMLPVTDAEVVAAQAIDGVLLVVKAGETSRRALAYVRKRLDQVGAKLVGAVLNCVPDSHREGYYYGSYYSAYYGPQGKDGSRRKVGPKTETDRARRGDS